MIGETLKQMCVLGKRKPQEYLIRLPVPACSENTPSASRKEEHRGFPPFHGKSSRVAIIHIGMKADPPTSDLPLLCDLPFGIYAGSPPAAEGGVASVNERGVKDDGVIVARLGLSMCGGTPPIDVEDIMMEPYAPLCRAFYVPSGGRFSHRMRQLQKPSTTSYGFV